MFECIRRVVINKSKTNQIKVTDIIAETPLFEDDNDGWKYTVGLELEHDISTDGPASDTGTE